MAKQIIAALRGTIIPLVEEDLKEIWRAFQGGRTWHRVGRKSTMRARFKHESYGGQLSLEWWGPAVHFEIIQDRSGMFTGAFFGQVKRHGGDAVDRIDVRFDIEH